MFASYCGDGTSRGLLSSIENLNISQLQNIKRKGQNKNDFKILVLAV